MFVDTKSNPLNHIYFCCCFVLFSIVCCCCFNRSTSRYGNNNKTLLFSSDMIRFVHASQCVFYALCKWLMFANFHQNLLQMWFHDYRFQFFWFSAYTYSNAQNEELILLSILFLFGSYLERKHHRQYLNKYFVPFKRFLSLFCRCEKRNQIQFTPLA